MVDRDLSRRHALALLGAGSLAGCLSSDGSTPAGTDTERTADDGPVLSVGEAAETDGRRVTLRDVGVRKLVATPAAGSPAHVDVAGSSGEQFVVGELVAEGSPVAAESLSVLADGAELEHAFYPWDTFRREGSPLRFALQVQTTTATAAAVAWTPPEGDRVRWRLSADATSALGAEPAFDVRAFETPDSVAAGDPIPATVTVANVGERDGRFVAELGAVVLSDVGEVRFDVPRGGTATREFSLQPSTYTPMSGDGGDPLRVVLDWGLGRLERAVAVE